MAEGRIYGYARVSSSSQKLDRQLLELRKFVPEENILTDKATGASVNRASYNALKGKLGLRAGDTLYITSLDRLSRNKEDIKNELVWFKEKRIRLIILDLPTSMIEVPEGQEWILLMVNNILIEVMSSVSEQERKMIRKRQREGIDAAKAKGKHLGRPKLQMPVDFPVIYEEWKRGELTAKAAMKKMKMSSTSFYRMVKKYEVTQKVYEK